MRRFMFTIYLCLLAGSVYALDIETIRSTPLQVEEVNRVEVAGPGPTNWASIGDSWVAQEGVDEKLRATSKLEVVDYYYTAGKGEAGENRVFCSVARPLGVEGKLPTLLVFHGGGGHADRYLATSVARANPGCAVIAMDYNGQFRPAKGPVTIWRTAADPRTNLRQFDSSTHYHALAVLAAQRGMDFLESFDWVDFDRLGLVGISYGGWIAFRTAAVDERVDLVVAMVSAGGVSGTGSYTSRPERYLPKAEADKWREQMEPMAAAKAIKCPVFLRLATNDRFFWLSGAQRFLDALPNKSNRWLLRPNSDHGQGGPVLPETTGQWVRAVFAQDAASFPKVKSLEVSEGKVTWKTSSELDQGTLWWSPTSAASPSRYWVALPGESSDGENWSVQVPNAWQGLAAQVFANVGRNEEIIVSSSVEAIPGLELMTEAGPSPWKDGCLWDIERGAEAWRAPLNAGPKKARIEDAKEGGVRLLPAKGGQALVAWTNSFVVASGGASSHPGISLTLGSESSGKEITVGILREAGSLDEIKYTAKAKIPEGGGVVSLNWSDFALAGKSKGPLFPFDTLEIASDSVTNDGITIRQIHYQK